MTRWEWLQEKVRLALENDIQECIPFEGRIEKTGYGHIKRDGRAIGAHVRSWVLANPEVVIKPGDHIMHLCDNRACVNPNHLSLGNAYLNALDCISKDRNPNFEWDPNLGIIFEIEHASGLSYREIAEKHGIKKQDVGNLIYRERKRAKSQARSSDT